MSNEFVISGRPPLIGYHTDIKADSFAQQIDEVDSNTTYFGLAKPGTPTSASLWQISKKTVSGTVTSFTWADGNCDFDNVWIDRATLTYT